MLKSALRTVTAQKKAIEEANAITTTSKNLSEIATSKGAEVRGDPPGPEPLPQQVFANTFDPPLLCTV